jgi:predicted dehydrogenase
MTASVGVGVVGLGKRWRRLLPSLHRLRTRLTVRAVCDPAVGRAEYEARRLGCAVVAGPVELLEREDVEALLLLDRPWYGLWPLERACAAGKPVFCAVPLTLDDQTDAVRTRVAEARLPVMMAPGRWGRLLHPRSARGVDVPGSPRLVRAEGTVRGRARLDSPALLPLLDASAAWCGTAPCSLWADEGTGFACVVLEFPDGRRGQVTLTEDPLGHRHCRLWLATEKGTVELSSPRRLCWRDGAGRHQRPLPDAGGLAAPLARFARAVRAGGPMQPSFAHAHAVLTWQRVALVSRREGRRMPLTGEGPGNL